MRLPTLATISAQLSWLFFALPAFAAEAKSPQWYEVATGVLAIPAAIIGLAYSFILIKKTRLEAKKTELEILEKKKQLREALQAQPEGVRSLLAPTAENRVGLYLVLRFVLLYLTLHAWGLVEDVYDILFTGMIAGAQSFWHLELSGWTVVPLVAIQKLPKVAYWVVFFALAWPLFKDINALLGLDLRGLFRLSRSSNSKPRLTDEDG